MSKTDEIIEKCMNEGYQYQVAIWEHTDADDVEISDALNEKIADIINQSKPREREGNQR